jgi:UPF0271 protein
MKVTENLENQALQPVATTASIDLNADVAEGFADEAIIPWLSSANLSCGAHAGDEHSIRRALRLCQQHQVAAGAHPSYPDRQQFGRVRLTMSLSALKQSLIQQLDYFLALAAQEQVQVHHLKAHGALYNVAAQDVEIADVLLEIAQHYQLPLMGLAQSPLQQRAAAHQVPFIAEAFADRGYLADGTLVPRQQPGALLNTSEAIAQSLHLVLTGKIQTVEQQTIELYADSICLHGDSPSAVALAKELSLALQANNIQIKPNVQVKPKLPLCNSQVKTRVQDNNNHN